MKFQHLSFVFIYMYYLLFFCVLVFRSSPYPRTNLKTFNNLKEDGHVVFLSPKEFDVR